MSKFDTGKINEALSLLNDAVKDQKDDISKLMTEKYSDLKESLSDLDAFSKPDKK